MRSQMYSLTRAAVLLVLLAGHAASQSALKPDPPKVDDATRIGLVTPRVTLLGGGGSVLQETTSLRQSITGYLTGPRIGTVDLRAKLDSLALEEGKERSCDYVLYVSLTRKRPAAPKGAVTSYGGGTKAGDEFTFEYKLVATDGKQAPVEKTLKATVSADGQDVLTPMIESTAEAIVGLARVAKPARPVSSEPRVTAETEPKPSATPAPERPPTGYGSLTAPVKSTTSTNAPDPPKAAGAVRIGIATPRVNYVGGGMSGNNEATSLRATVSSYLVGSNIEIIDLKARLDSLVLTEAQKRECDYVLFTNLLRKRNSSSSGSGGPLNTIMGNVGSGVGGTKVPGSKAAQDITSEAAKVSGTIAAFGKANDEMTFEYKLVTSVGARPITGKVTKAKVKQDGEDVLTPMIESAAQAIVDATAKP